MRRTFLEVCVFLGRTVRAPQVRRVDEASKAKRVHVLRITHRDEVESPITDWLEEAYGFSDAPKAKPARRTAKTAKQKATPKRTASRRASAKRP